MSRANFLVSLGAVASIAATPTALAEVARMERTGAFARQGPATPTCDNVLTGIEKYTGRALLYTAEFIERKADALARLAQGDPDALIKDINRTWADIESGAGYAAGHVAFLPLVLFEEVFKATLPEAEFTRFLEQGKQLRLDVASGVTTATLGVFEETVAEVSGDLWDVVENIDDPEAFGRAFSGKFQKWSPVGALTYLFTEGDPLKGAEKAANALLHQAEIFSTYVAPYAKAPSALVQGSTRAARAYNKLAQIPGFPGPSVDAFGIGTYNAVKGVVVDNLKQVAFDQMMARVDQAGYNDAQRSQVAALLAVVSARMDEAAVTGDHPFYRDTRIVEIPAEWMKDSHEDGGRHRWGLWHPQVENDSDCISLGDHVIADRGGHLQGKKLKAVCGRFANAVMGALNTWWARPIDYNLVWGDNCSGGTHDRSVWAPVCPHGYTSVGFVAWHGSWEKPLPNRIACLKNDADLMHYVDGATAWLRWTTSDEGSGAKYNLTAFNRKFADMELMHAVSGDHYVDGGTYPATIQVAVPWGMPDGRGNILWLNAQGGGDAQAQARFEQRKQERAAALQAALAQHDALARNPPSLAPDLLSPTDAAVATVRDGNLEFVWTEVDGAQRYAFYFGKSNPPPLLLADLTTGVATVPAATLPAGVYYWKAAALNDQDSGESPVFAVMVPEPAPTPIAASPAAAPAAGMVAADAAPQAANEMAPARQAPVALDTRYTHQVFGNKDSENTYYFNAADQFIKVTPQGEISLAGTVATVQDPRFVARIDGTKDLEAAIDANGAIWAEEGPGGALIQIGSVRALAAGGAPANTAIDQATPQQAAPQQAAPQQAAPQQAAAQQAAAQQAAAQQAAAQQAAAQQAAVQQAAVQQAAAQQAAAPRYTHRVFLSNEPGTFYVTASGQFVRVTDQGQVTQVGSVVASQYPNFGWGILNNENEWAGIDANGVLWTVDDETGNWVQAGHVTGN